MKLRVGVLGLGVGRAHLEALAKLPSVEVIGVCDFDQAKLTAAKSAFPTIEILTEDATRILQASDIQAVVIATYDENHASQVMSALASGKHVFVEKPFCTSKQSAQKIRRMLGEHPTLRFSSNLILRRYPWVLDLKSKIDRNELGTPFLLEADYNYGRLEKITEGWRGKQAHYSVTYGGGVHLIDLLLWLTNDDITRVSSFGTNIASRGSAFRFNDTVLSLLEFRSGAIARLSSNFGCVAPHHHKFSIYGTKATVERTYQTTTLYRSRDPKDLVECVRNDDQAKPEKGSYLLEFVNSILKGDANPVSVDDAFRAMSVCFAIEESMNTGLIKEVEYI